MALYAAFGWPGPQFSALWSMRMPVTQRTPLKAWMERWCGALGSMWSWHGRPNMTTPAITTLTLKAAATSVGTGATMPTTANVSARGVEVVGADHGLVPAPGHVAAVIDPVPAAMTTAGTAPHLIPDRGRGLASLCGPSPVHLLGVVPDLQARKRPTPGED